MKVRKKSSALFPQGRSKVALPFNSGTWRLDASRFSELHLLLDEILCNIVKVRKALPESFLSEVETLNFLFGQVTWRFTASTFRASRLLNDEVRCQQLRKHFLRFILHRRKKHFDTSRSGDSEVLSFSFRSGWLLLN